MSGRPVSKTGHLFVLCWTWTGFNSRTYSPYQTTRWILRSSLAFHLGNPCNIRAPSFFAQGWPTSHQKILALGSLPSTSAASFPCSCWVAAFFLLSVCNSHKSVLEYTCVKTAASTQVLLISNKECYAVCIVTMCEVLCFSPLMGNVSHFWFFFFNFILG